VPIASIDRLVEERAEFQPLGGAAKNLDFIFYNKVPKSGSTTMKKIFDVLSGLNYFSFEHVKITKFHHEQHHKFIHHLNKQGSKFIKFLLSF